MDLGLNIGDKLQNYKWIPESFNDGTYDNIKPRNDNDGFSLLDYLLPYQRAVVLDDSRFKIWIAARQIGKSVGAALEALILASSKMDTKVLMISASERQSNELLSRVRFWVKALQTGVGPDIVIRQNTEEIEIIGGSKIISLPANPDTIRGFSGHIFLDEFAFHRDTAKIMAAALPITTHGYKIRITSTPNGQQNLLYHIWTRGGQKWSRHMTSIHDAVAAGLDVDVDTLKSSIPDADIWAQEYECQFIDEATAYLTYEMIATVEHLDAGIPGKAGNGPFYIGADIARRKDLTVYWLLEKIGDILWTRKVVVLAKKTFAEQDRELDKLVNQFKPHRICMDQTSMGEKPVEDAQARYGRGRVEGINFSGPVKQDLAMGLKRSIEDRTLRIPDDKNVREDLHSVKKIVTPAGNVRLDADRTDDGHADRFWSLALAIHAASEPSAMPRIISGGGRTMASQVRGF